MSGSVLRSLDGISIYASGKLATSITTVMCVPFEQFFRINGVTDEEQKARKESFSNSP
jgi:hypothetical protein